MTTGLCGKGMVLGIIVLFLEVGIVPGIAKNEIINDDSEIQVNKSLLSISTPIVDINYPDDESVFDTSSVTVRGTASDFVDGLLGIKWIHISDHGNEERYYEFLEPRQGTYYFFFPFTLEEGWNSFTIVAYNTKGEEGSDSVIVYYYPEDIDPDLECDGSLQWSNINPGIEVTGSFTVENTGLINSKLDWEVLSWPDWGNWNFTPRGGSNLRPNDGKRIVSVSVEIPDIEDASFSGSVMVVNKEDSSDYCTIPVSLTTPKNKAINTPFLRFLENHPHMFPLLRQLLGLS